MDKFMAFINMFSGLSMDTKMFIGVIVVAGILSKLSTEPNS
jgi:hypothetical protein